MKYLLTLFIQITILSSAMAYTIDDLANLHEQKELSPDKIVKIVKHSMAKKDKEEKEQDLLLLNYFATVVAIMSATYEADIKTLIHHKVAKKQISDIQEEFNYSIEVLRALISSGVELSMLGTPTPKGDAIYQDTAMAAIVRDSYMKCSKQTLSILLNDGNESATMAYIINSEGQHFYISRKQLMQESYRNETTEDCKELEKIAKTL